MRLRVASSAEDASWSDGVQLPVIAAALQPVRRLRLREPTFLAMRASIPPDHQEPTRLQNRFARSVTARPGF